MSSTWRCGFCDSVNDDGTVQCVVCDRQRPVARDPSAEAVQFWPESQRPVGSSTVAAAVAVPARTPPVPASEAAHGARPRRGIVIAAAVAVFVVVVGVAAFALTRSGSSPVEPAALGSGVAGATSTTDADADADSGPGGGAGDSSAPSAASGTSIDQLSATATSPTTTSPTSTTSGPTTPPSTAATAAIEVIGVITGTCDASGSCGVQQRSAPYTAAARLSGGPETDLLDGAQVVIRCWTDGDYRTNAGKAGTTRWYRLDNGGYVPSVYVDVLIGAADTPC